MTYEMFFKLVKKLVKANGMVAFNFERVEPVIPGTIRYVFSWEGDPPNFKIASQYNYIQADCGWTLPVQAAIVQRMTSTYFTRDLREKAILLGWGGAVDVDEKLCGEVNV